MTEQSATEQTISETLASLGFTVSAQFQPFSKSRNCDETTPCINWRLKVTSRKGSMMVSYSQGYAHAPAYQAYEAERGVYSEVWNECENGQISETGEALPPPSVADVFYSLTSDAQMIEDAPTFAEWCANFGEAGNCAETHKQFMACKIEARKFTRLLEDGQLDQLAEIFEDY